MGFKPRKQEQYKKLYPDALHSDYACDKCGWVGSPKFSEGHKEPGRNFVCGSQESADFYRNKRFEWMAIWCAKNGVQLDLKDSIIDDVERLNRKMDAGAHDEAFQKEPTEEATEDNELKAGRI